MIRTRRAFAERKFRRQRLAFLCFGQSLIAFGLRSSASPRRIDSSASQDARPSRRSEVNRSKRQPSGAPLPCNRFAVAENPAARPPLDRAPSEGFTTSSRRCKISRIPDSRNAGNGKSMETVKLGKKGQMSIPKGILKRLGLEGDVTLLVDTTPEGAIVLRPAAIYPIEIYSDARIRSSMRPTAWMPRRRPGSRGSSSASEALLSGRQRHLHGGAQSRR